MASSSVTKATTASAQTDKAGAAPAPEAVQVAGISRREFLYYAWGASMALLLAESAGMLIWFSLPRFREGEFGGTFSLAGTDLPDLGNKPGNFPDGKFWLSNTALGVSALYKVCTHLGCLYAWVDATGRFECPCHGSKFEASGKFIEGPAPRSLDVFAITVTTVSGQTLTTGPEGDAIPVSKSDVSRIVVDTGTRIKRAGRI